MDSKKGPLKKGIVKKHFERNIGLDKSKFKQTGAKPMNFDLSPKLSTKINEIDKLFSTKMYHWQLIQITVAGHLQ